jgi:PIN domain nuclease of toxin-antitoxin system
VKLILDTSALLWVLLTPANLSATAARLLGDAANLLFVSVASLWEITIKVGIGKLAIPNSDIEEVIANLAAFRIRVLPIRSEDLKALQALPPHHKDPFDRIIVAQAQVEGIPIVTTDQRIQQYAVRVLW